MYLENLGRTREALEPPPQQDAANKFAEYKSKIKIMHPETLSILFILDSLENSAGRQYLF
jgi:hypothetical protein